MPHSASSRPATNSHTFTPFSVFLHCLSPISAFNNMQRQQAVKVENPFAHSVSIHCLLSTATMIIIVDDPIYHIIMSPFIINNGKFPQLRTIERSPSLTNCINLLSSIFTRAEFDYAKLNQKSLLCSSNPSSIQVVSCQLWPNIS